MYRSDTPYPSPQALGSNHPSQSRTTNPSAEVEERWHITLFPPHKETNAALESDGSLPEKLKKFPPASSSKEKDSTSWRTTGGGTNWGRARAAFFYPLPW